MPTAAPQKSLAPLTLQGIQVPKAVTDPDAFMRATRRQVLQNMIFSYAGLGSTDTKQLLQVGIISGISLKLSGSVTVTPGAGTVASTARWPYDLAKSVRLSANGQSNLINVGGWDLKVRDIMGLGDLTDRGVVRGIGGASPGTQVNQGTLSLANENWGVGQAVTAIPGGTYSIELHLFVPVAFDQKNLVGAIFAQTSSTELALNIDWASQSELFVTTGNATVSLALTVVVEVISYTIPQAQGGIIVPDLSVFHSLIKSRFPNPGNGTNEVKLAGQGVGRQLMRLYWRLFNGNGQASAPLPVNASNMGQVGLRFGGNDTPELLGDGLHLAELNERLFCADLGSKQGYAVLDFCSEFALRDTYDEGLASELRFLHEIPNAVALASPYFEYVQETLFAGAAGA